MTKPLTDAGLLGWQDILTDLERRLVSAEQDVKAGIGTPDGLGYTQAQRGYYRGRLAALTKARDALLPTIAREQTRRLNADTHEKAARSPVAATNGGDLDSETCTDDAAHSGATTEAA